MIPARAALAADNDADVYGSMNIRLCGNIVIVEITRPCVRTINELKQKTVDIAISLATHDKETSAVAVYSSAPGAPDGMATILVHHVNSFRAGKMTRSALLGKVVVKPIPERNGQNGRWQAEWKVATSKRLNV
jgi:hypothetical protein